jgi:Predicted secreted acid phosphatase
MTREQKLRRAVPCAACLTLGMLIGAGVSPTLARQAVAPPASASAAVNPQERVLYANLYMQTSAEYRAVCLQTYALATERLNERLANAALSDKQPAVVMDLDETVLDNGGYQAYLDRERGVFTDATWDVWERDFAGEVRLVPGAKEFIEAAEKRGVAVVYLTNRLEKNREGTIAALKHVGLSTENIEDRLLLKEGTSDKTARRAQAAERYQVLMLVGDNLRDFSEAFAAPRLEASDAAGQIRAIAARAQAVDKHRYRFGTDWFILPNPVYGEWERVLGPDPRTKLLPTRMRGAAGAPVATP